MDYLTELFKTGLEYGRQQLGLDPMQNAYPERPTAQPVNVAVDSQGRPVQTATPAPAAGGMSMVVVLVVVVAAIVLLKAKV